MYILMISEIFGRAFRMLEGMLLLFVIEGIKKIIVV